MTNFHAADLISLIINLQNIYRQRCEFEVFVPELSVWLLNARNSFQTSFIPLS